MKPIPPIRVGLCGEFEAGKSLLLNCLLGQRVALVGDLFPTTRFAVIYQWGQQSSVELFRSDETVACEFPSLEEFLNFLRSERATDSGKRRLEQFVEARVALNLQALQRTTLVDTPGIDASENDESRAYAVIKTLDFAVVVLTNYSRLNEKGCSASRFSGRKAS